MYRLGCSLYSEGCGKEKDNFEKHFRIKLKIFCLLPLTTSNKLLYKLYGEINNIFGNMRKKVQRKIEIMEEIPGAPEKLENAVRWRHIPTNLHLLICLAYGSKCKSHNHTNNTKHLEEEHGINVNIVKLGDNFQMHKNRSTVRSKINGAIRKIENLRKVGGRKRGRNWNKHWKK